MTASTVQQGLAPIVRASVHSGVPGDARRLIWDIFFVQARRGLDFSTHLPWSDAPGTRSVVLRDASDTTLATAVIRPAPQDGVAMIGFVCVDGSARGRGHAGTLISAVGQAIDAAGFRATLLWTGKPEIYVNRGYAIVTQDRLLHVARRDPGLLHPLSASALVQCEPWPPLGSLMALPAFASAGSRYRSSDAEAVVVSGAKGVTLLDWRGDPADVVMLLMAAGLDKWAVNLPSASPFAAALNPTTFAVTAHAGAITMARQADDSLTLDYVALANRI